MTKKRSLPKSIFFAFTVFLLVMGLLYAVLPKYEYSETEKRYLALFPDFTFERLADGDFTADFEKFMADQTPLRKFFVSLNAYYNLAMGNNGSAGIYLGKDGWLIEKPCKRDNNLAKNITRIAKFSDTLDIPSAMVAVPSKGWVYSDFLPSGSLEYYDGEYLSEAERLCGDSLDFINLGGAFKSAGKEKQLFYKTDHHWTSLGAYLAYTLICAEAGLDVYTHSDFDKTSTDGFYGTSYSKSCYTLTKPDSLEIWRGKTDGGRAKVYITDDGETTEYDNMFFDSALKESDKYVAFLGGNHSFVRIVSENKNTSGKLLVIKDSFAHSLVPFLAENYAEIVMIDLRYYKKPVTQLISSENFTQVLYIYGMENLAESRDIILR